MNIVRLLLPLLFVWSITAQHVPRYALPELENLLDLRRTQVDEDGKTVWKPHEQRECHRCDEDHRVVCPACRGGKAELAKKCVECRQKRRVRCTLCVGTGRIADPFKTLPCTRCTGRSRLACRVCGGLGRLNVVGAGAPACTGCTGKGGHKCAICNGKRVVPVLRAGKQALTAAKLEDLKTRAREVDELLQLVDAYLVDALKPKRGDARHQETWVKHHAELTARAGTLLRHWRREARSLAAIAKDLRKVDGDRLFSTRPIGSGATVPLECRASIEALGAELSYTRRALSRCIEVGEKNARGR